MRDTFRVFVSSTFVDMGAARDELVKRVFPYIRNLCQARGVTFAEVDLRWGITDEQVAEGELIATCLHEIERCQCFIGVLGDRYGMPLPPDAFSPSLVAQYPWLAEHRDKSLTELEIIHGALARPEQSANVYFYLGHPSDGDAPASPTQDEESERRHLLSNLEARIRSSGYPVSDGYADLQSFGALVRRDLQATVDAAYSEDELLTRGDRVRLEHHRFAAALAQSYIAPGDTAKLLERHLHDAGSPLAITGAAGAGKSALAASWWLSHSEPSVAYFVGADADSTQWHSVIIGVIEGLADATGLNLHIPEHPDLLRRALTPALRRVAEWGRLILIIDGVDQLADHSGALDLTWLPPDIPSNIRLLLTARPGRSLDVIRERQWTIEELPPLAVDERRRIIGETLSLYGKGLDPHRLDFIATAEPCGSPLYLCSILDELRRHADHGSLDSVIDEFLDATDVTQLFERILRRWEEDYERDRPGLVAEAMSLVLAARRGLSQRELLDLLGEVGAPLPLARCASLLLAAEERWMTHAPLLRFRHTYGGDAVRLRYLGEEATRQGVHQRLARYFAATGDTARALEELPWHLAAAEEWHDLIGLLTDASQLALLWQRDPYDVKRLWRLIQERSAHTVRDAYAEVIDQVSADPVHAWHVATLLRDLGYPSDALLLREHLLNHCRRTGDVMALRRALGDQAAVLVELGDLDDAEVLYREQEALCRQVHDRAGLRSALGDRAGVLRRRGDLAGAAELLMEQRTLCSGPDDTAALQVVMGNLALVLHLQGDSNEAIDLLREQEQHCREQEDMEALQSCLGNQATITRGIGQLREAMRLHRLEEKLCADTGNQHGLQASLTHQAQIQHALGHCDSAAELFDRAEAICVRSGYLDGLRAVLGSRALVHMSRGNLAEAEELHQREAELCRRLGDPLALQIALGNLSLVVLDGGRPEQAMELATEQYKICDRLGYRDGLQAALDNRGRALHALGDLEGALELFLQAESICRDIGNPFALQESLGNQGRVHLESKRAREAIELFREQERVCRELENPEGLIRALSDCATAALLLGREDEAAACQEQASELASRHDSLANRS